jgi:GNAT superfamily N-acetyltransferase
MVDTDLAPETATLSDADVEACLALSREADWNQTARDWRHFLTQGTVFGRRERSGRLVASAALLPYGEAAWISMVLVTRAFRRRGLAEGLMRRCLEAARARGLEPWLDATPDGALVYARLGFHETGLDLVRMRRPGATAAAGCAESGDLDDLEARDRATLRLDRRDLLGALARRPGSRVVGRRGGAVALLREGDRASHLGPLYAADEEAAIALCAAVLALEPGPLLLDIVAGRAALAAWLGARGFAVERPFARMRLSATPFPPPPALMAVAGPEFG